MELQEDINKKIFERIEKLEKTVFSTEPVKSFKSDKVQSIAEIVRKKKLDNGQKKVAAIVGYYEKIGNKSMVTHADMRTGWKSAKFDGSFANILAARAEKDGLISSYGEKDSYVLTQTGEDFWKELLS